MNKEIQYLIKQYQTAYDGNPWFGRCIKDILTEINPAIVVQKLNGQHSMLELLYHMITWREFVISRFDKENKLTATHFSKNNWRKLDIKDGSLWEKGLRTLEGTQKILIDLLENLKEEDLTRQVTDRKYDFRHMLYGVLTHDIYHLGQIAYVKKMLD